MAAHEGQRLGAAVNREKALVRDKKILGWLDAGFSYLAIAAALDIDPDSVRTVVYRARQRAGIHVRPYRKP